MAHTQNVTVQSCNARGQVAAGSVEVRATAAIVTGPEFDAIRAKVIAKCGFVTKITKFIGTLAGVAKGKRIPYGDIGVVVTVGDVSNS